MTGDDKSTGLEKVLFFGRAHGFFMLFSRVKQGSETEKSALRILLPVFCHFPEALEDLNPYR